MHLLGSRCRSAFNPPRLAAPLDWLRRDHRKALGVDGQVAFVTGLCIAKEWAGDPSRGREPWRDTGVEIRGPAVADVEQAFAEAWAETGEGLPEEERARPAPAPEGNVSMRVVAGTTSSTGAFRLDTLVAALARQRLWLADAYFAGTSTYVQALRAAAHDGVDVRLLVPGAGSDITLVQAFSRAGYRPLLEAGVRVFEWNGHHERWDGKGYPEGLVGEDIPLAARIVAVADCFDAITTNRPYNLARSLQEAYADILGGAGSKYDPAVVEAFRRAWDLWHIQRITVEKDASL